MAITISEAVAETTNSNNATSYAGAAFTPGAGEILVALVFVTGSGGGGPAMTGTWAWKQQTGIAYNASADSTWLFTAEAGAATSTTPTFECASDGGTGIEMNVFRVAGANTFDPVRQTKAEARTAANPTLTWSLTPLTSSGLIVGFGMPRSPPASTAPSTGGGWTETMDIGHSTPTGGASAAFKATGETSTTAVFTSLSAAYGIIGIEINEALQGQQPVDLCGMMGMCGI